MEDQTRANLLSAAFPAPPPFYKYFTTENLARLSAANENPAISNGNTDDDAKPLSNTLAHRLQDLPRELLYLIPPEPPVSGQYRSFGDDFDISNALPSLRSRGIEQLYPTPPSSPSPNSTSTTTTIELTKLTRSLLFTFLELTGLLSTNPSLAAQKIEDLRILFFNLHHLINGYRPHQARETVIEMVEAQIKRRRGEIDGVRKMKDRVDGILAGLGSGSNVRLEAGEGRGGGAEQVLRQKSVQEHKAVWAALDEIEV